MKNLIKLSLIIATWTNYHFCKFFNSRHMLYSLFWELYKNLGHTRSVFKEILMELYQYYVKGHCGCNFLPVYWYLKIEITFSKKLTLREEGSCECFCQISPVLTSNYLPSFSATYQSWSKYTHPHIVLSICPYNWSIISYNIGFTSSAVWTH